MDMSYLYIAFEWVATITLLVKFIPRNEIRKALVALLFMQVLTWVLGLTVVELRLIQYPVRLFPHASKTSFSFEYFVCPSICAIFNVNYPKNKSVFSQFMYYFYFCTSMTIIEVIVERYTNIIKYTHWTWYVTWITLFITFYLARKFFEWFFKLKEKR